MMWGSLQQRGELDQALSRELPAWLADEFLESYISWREEAAGARSAYEQWVAAPGADESVAFAAYWAALDREEHAAEVLRESVERISATQI